jgi:hypothetical protein
MIETVQRTRTPATVLPETPRVPGPRRSRIGIAIVAMVVAALTGLGIVMAMSGASGDADWFTYTDPSGRFVVDHPRTAEVVERGSGPERSVMFIEGQAHDRVGLFVGPFAPGAGFDARLAAAGEAYGAAEVGGGNVIASADPVTIAGTDGYRNVIDYGNVTRVSIFVDVGDEVLIVSGAARNDVEGWTDLFDRFAGSFELTTP